MTWALADVGKIDATTIFYLTLLFIFLAAIVTTLATKWSRDKCLKFFRGYRVTLERYRGQTIWGTLNVFSAGVEIIYDYPYIDPQGHKKTSFMFYQQDVELQVLMLIRNNSQLPAELQERRRKQVYRQFNPRFFRRLWRTLRNVVNTFRDAFNAAIGAAVVQFQKENPTGAALGAQTGAVTTMGQTLVGKFGNAYEPMLEQYIGQPVILEVADPLNPNNASHQYAGYLADYTAQFIAVFNVEHPTGTAIELMLPDLEEGPAQSPLGPPPPPGAAAPTSPPPIATQDGVEFRIDGRRLLIRNGREDLLAVRRLEKAGFQPLDMGVVIAPNGMLHLPARDARGGKLVCEAMLRVDIVAPRRYATVRHAGELVKQSTLADELALDRLPLVSLLFGGNGRKQEDHPDEKEQQSREA